MLDRELLSIFLGEARAHLDVITDIARPAESRLVAAHGLKGAAGTVGEQALREAAQALEDALRKGHLDRVADLTRRVSALVEAVEVCHGPSLLDLDPEDASAVREVFLAEAHDHLDAMGRAILLLRSTSPERGGSDARDRAGGQVERLGTRAAYEELFRKVHTLKSAGGAGFDAVGHAAHRLEDQLEVLGASGAADPGVLAALEGIADVIRSLVEEGGAGGRAVPLLAEVLVRIEDLAAQRSAAHHAEPSTAERRRPSSSPLPQLIELVPSLGPDRRAPEATSPGRRREDLQTLRVEPDRVEDLLDTVGEVVIDRTRIERRVFELRGLIRDLGASRATLRGSLGVYRRVNPRDPVAVDEAASDLVGATNQLREVEGELSETLQNLERLAALLADDVESVRKCGQRLQEQLQRMRMLPVRSLFSRLGRVAREAARAEAKLVEVETFGDATELDRTMSERLAEGLLQLVRNAVAHGIEDPEERERRGKPPVGVITLQARQEGDLFYIDVADDGAGVDTDLIRATLVRTGRATAEEAAHASDDELLAAIFEPGFSTRQGADAVAGRGIGLDVVRDSIARMGGSVTIASRPGDGTRFTIRLPLMTMITQALLFKVAGFVYAIPGVHVLETFEVAPADLDEGGQAVRVRGAPLPLVWLDQLFGTAPRPTAHVFALLLLYGDSRFVVGCDKVIGPREIVVKPLPPLLEGAELFAGATISGAGKVQLVLDVAALAGHARAGVRARRLPSAAPAPRRPRILLADDSRTVRETVSRILSSSGYVVEAAADGWEAWELLHERHFDLLLTDLEMPRIGGIELCEKVRREPRLAELPIVVISSRTSEAHRQDASAAGAVDFIKKPVLRRPLLESVAGALTKPQ